MKGATGVDEDFHALKRQSRAHGLGLSQLFAELNAYA